MTTKHEVATVELMMLLIKEEHKKKQRRQIHLVASVAYISRKLCVVCIILIATFIHILIIYFVSIRGYLCCTCGRIYYFNGYSFIEKLCYFELFIITITVVIEYWTKSKIQVR